MRTAILALLVLLPAPAQDDDLEPTAGIKAVFVEDGRKEYEYGTFLKVDFWIRGCFERPCTLVVWFYDQQKKPLKDKNGEYRDVNGNVSATNDFKPAFARAVYTKYPVFIPHNELHLPAGSHDLLFRIGVFLREGGRWQEIAKSGFYELSFEWKLRETGEITKLDAEFDAKKGDAKGIRFTLDYVLRGAKDRTCAFTVEFYYDLAKLPYLYKHGNEEEGTMSFSTEVVPKRDDAQFNGGHYWVPYGLFPLKGGRNVFYYKVWLQVRGDDDEWTTLDASSAKEFYIRHGDLKLAEVWVVDEKKVVLDWEPSEEEQGKIEAGLTEFNRFLYDASDGQIRIRGFRLSTGADHPDHHFEPVLRFYRDFKSGDHGKLNEKMRGFARDMRSFAFFGTPQRPGDMHLSYELLAKRGPKRYGATIVHEFHHATFGLGDEYGESTDDEGKNVFTPLCAETEVLRHAWNACIMATHDPFHRELCTPRTHAGDGSDSRLHKLDCYTRVRQALKKAYDLDLIIPETPIEGPTGPPDPRFTWE